MTALIAYGVFATILTIWLANVLSRHGGVLLRDVFPSSHLAESVNQLLVVGFYLVNFAFAASFMSEGFTTWRDTGVLGGERIWLTSSTDLVLAFSSHIAQLLGTLGVMHFINLFVLTRVRSRSRRTLLAA